MVLEYVIQAQVTAVSLNRVVPVTFVWLWSTGFVAAIMLPAVLIGRRSHDGCGRFLPRHAIGGRPVLALLLWRDLSSTALFGFGLAIAGEYFATSAPVSSNHAND